MELSDVEKTQLRKLLEDSIKTYEHQEDSASMMGSVGSFYKEKITWAKNILNKIG